MNYVIKSTDKIDYRVKLNKLNKLCWVVEVVEFDYMKSKKVKEFDFFNFSAAFFAATSIAEAIRTTGFKI